MAQLILERACNRFQNDVSVEDARMITSTSKFDDVTHAIRQIERQLAARQELRNFDRLAPFLSAIENYSKALEVACNGTPYLPWVWAPIKLVLVAVQDSTRALDKIIVAYGNIASSMPRLSRFSNSFPNDVQFQKLIAFFFEDIIEFHRRAYALIRKPGWKFFFSSSWGRFEYRFDNLLESMAHTSDLIDREAAALDIAEAVEWRKTEAETAQKREYQRNAEQLQAVLDWLEASRSDQEMKLEWLQNRCYDGTSSWITSNSKFRAWLQNGHGNRLLWLYGKPGSGKSVLSAQVVHYLRNSQRPVCFFFCDFHTPPESVTARIFKMICAQMVSMSHHLVPYLYEEYVSEGKPASSTVLKQLLPHLLQHVDDLRIVVDGVDEVSSSIHRNLIKDLLSLTKLPDTKCRLLVVSQDVPSISTQLARAPRLSLNEESRSIERDLSMIIDDRLEDINDQHSGALGEDVICSVKRDILAKAEGMFLWVHLILELLHNASNLDELQEQVHNLPADLAEVYKKILNNIISRCSPTDVTKIRRIFSWMILQKGLHPLRKYQARVAMVLSPECQTMTKKTRPFANSTDICKPFVEDGPGGSLVFVHASVPQFLCDESSGRFVVPEESRLSLTSGCISQITQSLDLLLTQNRAALFTEGYINIIFGFYALLPYAYEHWMSHLRDCLVENVPPYVYGQLKGLCHRLRQFPLPDGAPDIASSTGISIIDPRLSQILAEEDVILIRRCWAEEGDGPPELDRSHMAVPILLRALQKYNETIQFLTSQAHVEGVSQQDFLNFKEEHGSTAFVCDRRGCDRALLGFPSMATLLEHRSLHQDNLKCPTQGCAYNEVGFKNIKGLQDHRRKRHRAAKDLQVPRRFRRKATLKEPQRKKRLMMARAENPGHVSTGNTASNHAFQDYQMQLILKEQENKKRLMMARAENPGHVSTGNTASNHVIQDYQMQLMLKEQENKKRLLMARAAQEKGSTSS
ncbi:hypothetical protein F5Y19DRAFT_468906 [Xylariaceae sp. FL1651]|nr:hypothetical protein F5Y19DRAFT_468906 [Xylariaceae sp. FL1651]